ncbi:uncharacterized protein LOC132554894 [Ylistrum balloti]|uniref:uncharacterized protein LOC132554894 n=1 Tax=Ylistrum balloti TaxID=509963 RepID=UPI002905D4BB|nr:uncharacterized protein LOC132554894 [Ylistrum balloti]
MQPTNMRGSPPDMIQTPYTHRLLAFAGHELRSYMNNTDRYEDSFASTGPSVGYANQGHTTPVVTQDDREEEYSPPTPPRTPNHSTSAPYQQRNHPDARVGVSMRLSPLTVKTDMTSPEDQHATSAVSGVHSDPCSLTSPRHTKFLDDMDNMLQTKQAMAQLLYEAMKEHQTKLNPVSAAYTDSNLKPFPLKDPPKSKSKFKRQISTESNDPSDIKVGMKSPIKRLQSKCYDEPDYTERTNLQNRNTSNAPPQGSTCQTADVPSKDSKKEDPASQHPYAMNVKWIFSETDPSPKKEEDFTEISVVDEISKSNGEGVDRCEHSFAQSSQDASRNIGSFRTVDATNNGCNHNNQAESISNDLYKYRMEVGKTRSSKDEEQDCLSLSTSPRKTGEVTKGRGYDSVVTVRGSEMTGGYTSDLKSGGDSVRHGEHSKQKLGEDMYMMMSGLRNRDGRTTGTATTEMSHVTSKGFVFPPEANIKEPIPMSPRIVCTPTRTSVSTECDSSSRATPRNASQRPPSMTSTRTTSLSRQMMPSPTSKEQTMYGWDVSLYQREVGNQRRRFFHSMSDTDHSPSKHEIEQMKSLNRTISDPSCFSPSKKNMLAEEIIRMDPQYLVTGGQYDEEELSRPYSDEDRQYSSTQYHQTERAPGIPGYHGSESARRQLFSEASGAPHQYKHRVPRESARDRIPDDIASFLVMSKFCTAEDIISFNEKDKLCPRDVQDYRLTRDWMMARHVTGNYRQSDDFNVRPQEEYGSRLQIPTRQVSYQAPSPPQRKRNRGEVDIRMVCEDFRLSDKTKNFRFADDAAKNCQCANVENEILEMARDAFAKIRRKDDSAEAHDQFGKELQETKSRIYQAFDILSGVKAICKHERTVVDMFSGSVVFRVRCPTVFALDNLWDSYQSGDLNTIVNRHFVWDSLRSKYSDMDIGLIVTIAEGEYQLARAELGTLMSPGRLDNSLSKSDTEIASITGDSVKENFRCTKVLSSASHLGIIHSRCQSAPVTPSPASSPSWLPKSPMSPLGGDRKFTFPGEPRRIFQERNKGSCSPTMKKLFDFELNLSPKTSPKRKTFAEGFPRENVHPEVHSPKRKNNGTSFPFKDKSNDVET